LVFKRILAIFNSDLPANTKPREKIITEYTPKPLLELIGLENILKRVPENYLNAIVASKVARNFVYTYGMESNEIDFYNYLRNFVT
jgi:glutamate dehydrogenase